MPLDGYSSLCDKNATQIVSKGRGGAQKHIANNTMRCYVTHYIIDGVVITTGNRCDNLLMNEDKKVAYLIELKGSDLSWAAKQIAATESTLSDQLSQYDLQYRIVANKCKTQEIENSDFKKYRIRWNNRLIYKTTKLEESI